jgi:hypothetical protein
MHRPVKRCNFPQSFFCNVKGGHAVGRVKIELFAGHLVYVPSVSYSFIVARINIIPSFTDKTPKTAENFRFEHRV